MRNPSPKSIRSADFAKYFGRSPYYLGPNHIRQYQAYLFRDRKLLGQTVRVRTAALRFLYVKTLKPSRSRYRLPRHPAHVGSSPGTSSPRALHRAGLWTVC